jgi:von Willebrand factor type A domain.
MASLEFTSQYTNLLLLLNGLAIVLYIGARSKKKQRAMKFGNYSTLEKVAGRNFLKSSNLLLFTKLGAITLLVIGISNPVIVESASSTQNDYVLAVDVSGSMIQTDLKPSRLGAAKRGLKSFVDATGNETSIGVVSFSGSVSTEQDLAADKREAKQAIEALDSGESGAGTAIGDAIFSSVSTALQSSGGAEVVLVTDGRKTIGSDVNSSIRFARQNNVTVNTYGIGSRRNSTQGFGTIRQGDTEVNASRRTFPNLDTAQLERVANETGGNFSTVESSSELGKDIVELEEEERRRDISRFFVFGALALLLLEWVLGNTRFDILP